MSASSPWWLGVARAVASRPWLWSSSVTQLVRLAPRGWWRRWPPLPRPDRAYLRFRLQTAYGDADRHPEPADVVAYLAWCRRASPLRPLSVPASRRRRGRERSRRREC